MAIKHKRKLTTGYTWLNGDLAEGQIGMNVADQTLHIADGAGDIESISTDAVNAGTYVKNTDIDVTVQSYDINTRTLKDNLAASTSPGVNDDTTAGYSVGSQWVDTTADSTYVCVDSSTGAAIWNITDAQVSGAAGTDLQVQFNDNGALAGDADMTFDPIDGYLTLLNGVHLGTGNSALNEGVLVLDTPGVSAQIVLDTQASGEAMLFFKTNSANRGVLRTRSDTIELSNRNTGSELGIVIANTGLVSVLNTVDYETLITADDDFITKKYADDNYSGGGAASLDGLSDVTITGGATRHSLMNNGSNVYVNRLLVEADVSDLQSYLLPADIGVSVQSYDINTRTLKDNLAAAVAPSISSDNTQGYAVGSEWIDTTADKAYVALDVSTGAAVWTETTQSGGGGGTPAGLDTQIQYNNGGVFGADAAMVFNDSTKQVNMYGPLHVKGGGVIGNVTIDGSAQSALQFQHSGGGYVSVYSIGTGGLSFRIDEQSSSKNIEFESSGLISSSLGASYAALVTADGDLTDKKYVDDAVAGAGGANNWLTANNGVDFTTAPTAVGTRAICIGDASTADTTDSIRIGSNLFGTQNLSTQAISIGMLGNNVDIGQYSVCIGKEVHDTNGGSSVIIGDQAIGLASNAISIGSSCSAEGDGIAMGGSSAASALGDIAIGSVAQTPGSSFGGDICIGKNTSINGGNGDAISIGTNALADAGSLEIRVNHTAGAPAKLKMDIEGNVSCEGTVGAFKLTSYTVGSLPFPGFAGMMIYVTDESGGEVSAVSDSSGNWRRTTDRAIVS